MADGKTGLIPADPTLLPVSGSPQLTLCKVAASPFHNLSSSCRENIPGPLERKYQDHLASESIWTLESASTIIPPALNCLELFCGRAEVSRAFKLRGHNTFSTDKRKRAGVCEPDLQIPVEKLFRRMIPFSHVHAAWASIPCTAFSYGAGNYYYAGKYAKENAQRFLKLLKITLEILDESNPDFFFIENPRGKLRYEKLMVDWCAKHAAVIKEVTLGSYGFPTIKPTDIFTNAYDWQPRKKLSYGRGAKNYAGLLLTNLTQAQRQATPVALAEELCDYIEGKFYPGVSEKIHPLTQISSL